MQTFPKIETLKTQKDDDLPQTYGAILFVKVARKVALVCTAHVKKKIFFFLFGMYVLFRLLGKEKRKDIISVIR